jgi:hypothetical protein
MNPDTLPAIGEHIKITGNSGNAVLDEGLLGSWRVVGVSPVANGEFTVELEKQCGDWTPHIHAVSSATHER